MASVYINIGEKVAKMKEVFTDSVFVSLLGNITNKMLLFKKKKPTTDR